MDRRTILFLAAVMVILGGYQLVIQKFFPPEPNLEEIAADSEMIAGSTEVDSEKPFELVNNVPADPINTTTAEINNDLNAALTVDSALQVISAPSSRLIEVNTPLYKVKIDTRGGRIVSWEGLEHPSYLGGSVQLVPEEIPAAENNGLIFRQGKIDLSNVVYSSKHQGNLFLTDENALGSLVLTTETKGGLELQKVFTFDANVYGFNVEMVLVSKDQTLAQQSLSLLGSPEDFQFGWNQGILMTERVQKMEKSSVRSLAAVGDQIENKKWMDLEKSVEKVEGRYSGSVHYAALQNRYFAIYGIVPQKEGEVVEGRIELSGDQEFNAQSWQIEVPALRGSGNIIASAKLDYYIGPQQTERLSVYGEGISNSIDLGYRWIRPLSQLVLAIMDLLHKFIPNYGVIIIIFSLLTKLMFYPLTKSQTKSMKKMQELQPKLAALKEKFKNDKEKLNQATMELYKEEKVNPLAGCLPLVVQMPVFFALYQALSHTISLRAQPFFGWINDLSQPDAIAQLPFALPFLGSDLNVLPILMSVAMYFQTKLTPNSGGGQMAMMNTMMPLIMIFIFYSMPSGLVLYWFVNTVLQAYQSWKIHQTPAADGSVQQA